MEQTSYRQLLNNYLQEVCRVDPRRSLTWERSCEGSGHRPTWKAVAYLDEIEWGRGEGPTLDIAKEAAAKRVLIAKRVLPENA